MEHSKVSCNIGDNGLLWNRVFHGINTSSSSAVISAEKIFKKLENLYLNKLKFKLNRMFYGMLNSAFRIIRHSLYIVLQYCFLNYFIQNDFLQCYYV